VRRVTSLIGRRLGRYELRAELGRGGMARVYRAVDTLLQRQVAIKVLAAQLSLDPEFVRRFDREATTAANLRHPAIVTVYDVGEQDGLYYIAMEYVSGRSLQGVLEERTTLGLGYAVTLLDPVARALDYAHTQGAVHRDIKPHNILIDRDGRVLLTDFGIAQTPDSDGERLTRTGIFMGTPEYISPEQAEAQRVDGRSDLYSLGVVAYEIITGRVPFSGATPQLIVAHSQLPPPPPTSVLAHLPGELDEVLAKALSKRPERRFASGQAFVEAMRGIAARYGTPVAGREQIAALADGPGAQLPSLPQPVPAPPPRPVPAAAEARRAPNAVRPAPPAPPAAAGQPTARANAQPAPPPPRPQAPGRPQTGSAARPRSSQPYLAEPDRDRSSQLPLLLIGALLVAFTAALIFFVARGFANGGPPPLPTSAPATPSLTLPAPSEAVASPTGGLVTTMLPVQTSLPTSSAEPSSATQGTPVQPTARPPTQAPQPTLAPQPQPTTPLPLPSALPEPSLTPTPEITSIPTDTSTPEPPTPTPTQTDTPEPSPTEAPPILDGTPTFVTPVGP
jgi:serine/threonine-protein kinase